MSSRDWERERSRSLDTLRRALSGAAGLSASQPELISPYFDSVVRLVGGVFGKGSPWLGKLFGISWNHGVLSRFGGVNASGEKFLEAKGEFQALVASLIDELELFSDWPLEVRAKVKSDKIILVQGADKNLNASVKLLLAKLDLGHVLVRQEPLGKSVVASLGVVTKNIGQAILLPPFGGPASPSSEAAFRNLLFAAGHLAAKLGPEAVLLICDKGLSPPSVSVRTPDRSLVGEICELGIRALENTSNNSFFADVAQWLKESGYFVENKTIEAIREHGLGKLRRSSRRKSFDAA